MNLTETGNKIERLNESTKWLKSELHSAIQNGNIISARYYYDLINDVEAEKLPLIELIDEYCQLN